MRLCENTLHGRWYHGSPAQRYGLYALNWVASVNGEPTPDLDTFVKVTQGLEDGSFVRLKLISLTARPKVLTVKLDLHYWWVPASPFITRVTCHVCIRRST